MLKVENFSGAFRAVAASAVLCLGFAASASAAVLTSNTISNPTTIDFSQFSAAPVSNAPGPVQVGGLVGEDISLTGNPNDGLYAWNSFWGLGANGDWDSGRDGWAGANNGRPGSLIFTFNDGAVSAVGGFMNHAPNFDTNLIIRAFGLGNVLLESYDITANSPIITPNALNDGAFFGFSRAAADIVAFEIYGYVPVVDDLAFTRGPAEIPVPAGLPLLMTGLAVLGVMRRRRRHA